MNYTDIIRRGAVLCVIAATISACKTTSTTSTPANDPEFTSFSIAPNLVCLNQGFPLVQVSYEFDIGDWSNPSTLCTTLRVDGQTIPTLRHLCADDGTSSTFTFNLNDVFGTNVPPQVTVEVELGPSIAGDAEDVVSGSVQTRIDCPPASPTPGG